MDNKAFEWTDALVAKYGEECLEKGQPFSLEAFKASKQPKPEWEILEGKSALKGIHYWTEETEHEYGCQKSRCEIYKVERLGDGEVFAVGDEVRFTYTAEWKGEVTAHFQIVAFRILGDNKMYAIGSAMKTDFCQLLTSIHPFKEYAIPVSLTPAEIEKLHKILSKE